MFRHQMGIAIVALATSITTLVHAQTPQTPPQSQNQAGQNTQREAKPPFIGKNSFTETQARERIANAGYQDVKMKELDQNGIWRADAQKSGQTVQVSLDFRGNVVQQ